MVLPSSGDPPELIDAFLPMGSLKGVTLGWNIPVVPPTLLPALVPNMSILLFRGRDVPAVSTIGEVMIPDEIDCLCRNARDVSPAKGGVRE